MGDITWRVYVDWDANGNLSSVGVNKITNPTFEVDTSGWAAGGTGAISRDTTQHYAGAASLKLIATAIFDSAFFAFTALASTRYTYSAWIYSVAGVTVTINLTDNIDQGMDSGNFVIPAATWTQVSFTATTDSHTARQFRVYLNQAGPATFWIDEPNVYAMAGVYGDVSAAVYEVGGKGGRSSGTDLVGASTCDIVLDNPSGLYSRDNAASALYGLMLPGREVKVESSHDAGAGAVVTVQFRGRLVDIDETIGETEIPSVRLSCVDGLDELSRKELRTTLYETQRVDQLVTIVLDAAGWSATRRNLDTAITTIDRWWAQRTPATAALQTLGQQELGGGLIYINRAGDVRFENRDARTRAAVYTTLTNAVGQLSRGARFGDLVGRVELTRSGLIQDTATSVMWSLSPGGRKLRPGAIDPDNRIDFEYSIGGKAAISPVAVTDYVANSAADGTGTDKTAQVTVSSFTAYGGGGSILFNNLDSADVYLVGTPVCQVRGQAIGQANEDRIIAVTPPSVIATAQVFSREYAWLDDIPILVAEANLLAGTLSQDRPRPVLSLPTMVDAEIAVALGIEVSKRITVSITGGVYQPYLSGDYFVESYAWRQVPDQNFEMTLTLWGEDQGLGTGFLVSPDSPGAALSLIASDAATTGYDRIWL